LKISSVKNEALARFERYIGIDSSGAGIPTQDPTGSRVYLAIARTGAFEALPPAGGSQYRSWRKIVLWSAFLEDFEYH
jgi:hypothetical protein